MIALGRLPSLTLLMFAIFSCDNNITISKATSHYDAKVHLKTVSEGEKLPPGVRELFIKKPASKYPLSYFLIQEEDAQFLRTKNFDPKIIDQLSLSVSGVKYYKLFVHPELDSAYKFLMHAYRYIGPDETEFTASPIEGAKTVVAWSEKNLIRKPFIVKIVLNDDALKALNARLPADSHLTPEFVNLVFKRPIKNSKEVIQGQQITSIPEIPSDNK